MEGKHGGWRMAGISMWLSQIRWAGKRVGRLLLENGKEIIGETHRTHGHCLEPTTSNTFNTYATKI